MPSLNHVWQRFLLTSSLFVGLAIGVISTVFGYSNQASVDVHIWSFKITGVPLWSVAVVPLAIALAVGTLYHWVDGLHHFTEHMRHRHRVHELEAELASLRVHLDQVLEMPDHSRLPAKGETLPPLPEPEPVALEPAKESEPIPAVIETTPAAIEATPAATEAARAGVAVSPAPEPAAPRPRGERRKRARLSVASVTAPEQANGEGSSAHAVPAAPAPGA
ncbi:MAG TPA: hypothetical protein VLR46_02145 [Candidatus Dormibacteraeota bacterium]|nr:hypothetical protein [Candidatus Dormibacteraeota bacterium]